MAIAEIHVTLKPTLLDTQGATVAKALHQLGYAAVRDVRIGKFITVEVDDAQVGPALQKQLEEMCAKLLANPVIEDYEIAFDAPNAEVQPPLATIPVTPLVDIPLTNAPLSNRAAAEGMAVAPVVSDAPLSTLSPAEQLATAQISRSEAATPDALAMDYARFESMSAPDKLALQELAWRKHGAWILNQLNQRNAQWILCAGDEVVNSGASIDSFPSDAQRAQIGQSRGLVPWVFVRPPQS
jgi:phosphoribosylformylglycinamidine synthase PurS subunit